MPGQNVYDDPAFFDGYQAMRSASGGFNEALEQPAMRALLPAVSGLDVVDLGCGDGGLSRDLAAAGAASVLAVDPSARMLELARARTSESQVRFEQAFAEQLELPPACADVVVSSLAVHYVADLPALLAAIASWLRPGGTFLASMEHPIVTAAPGRAVESGWVVADYVDEGPRRTRWYVDGVVKYHRTAASIVTAVLGTGLTLTALAEPAPTPSVVRERPDLLVHRQRPALLLVRAQRRSS